MKGTGAVVATAVVATTAALVPAAPASAALSQLGPISPAGTPADGFPTWYADQNGFALQPCLDGPPVCLAGPTDLTLGAPGATGEAFYFNAAAGVGPITVTNALEATYLPTFAAGNQVTFARTQIDAKGVVANGVYTVTDPYGTLTSCTAGSDGIIRKNACRTETPAVPLDFRSALAGRISPFLTWDTYADPTLGAPPPAGYIGDNATPHKVVGSPTGFNKVRVVGPGINDGTQPCAADWTGPASDCAETDLFIVQGKVQPSAAASLSSSALDFGNTGTAVTKSVSLTSTGTLDVTVGTVTATGSPDFAVTNNTCDAATLPTGSKCTFDVTYSPTAAGAATGTITVTDSTVASPRTISLKGSSNPVSTVDVPSLAFGSQKVGLTSATETVTVGNTGVQPLTVSGATSSSRQFKVDPNACTTTPVPVGGSCDVVVAFAPTSNGVKTGTLTIATDGGNRTVGLTGTGTTPVVSVLPATGLTFVDTPTGSTSAARSVTLTNGGTAPVTIDGVDVVGTDASQFALETNTCTIGANVAPGLSCVTRVVFKPTTAGAKSGTLSISADGAVSTVALSGNGVAPPDTTKPSMPTGVQVAASSDTTLDVSWTASTDNVGVVGYRVYRDGAITTPLTTVTTTSFGDTGLAAGSTHSYRISAIDAAGNESTLAAAVSGTTKDVPGAPTGVSASAGDASATVSWSAPVSDGGSAITGYKVRAFDGTTQVGTAKPTAGSVTSTSIGGLTNGTAYTFEVVAVNAVGDSVPSGRSAPVTPKAAATRPGAPTGVSASAGDASATVSWSAPVSDGGSAITGYSVRAFSGTTLVSTTPVTGGAVTSTSISGLTNGTAYTFDVAAVNAIGTGAFSGPSTAVTPKAAVAKPGAPTGVTPTIGNASATVRWTAPASNGGAAITGYSVRTWSGTTLVKTTPVGAVTSTVIGTLTNGTAYTFDVAAVNSAGTGAFSARSAAVTPRSDLVAPTVTARSPGSAATGVANTANVTATFSEAVTGVSGTSVTLKNAAGVTVAGTTVSYNATTRVATLDPGGATTTNLANDTTYTVSLTAGIKDTAGNALAATSWKFTTGPVPTVSARTPGSGAVGVSRSTNVTVTFSEAVTGIPVTPITLQQLSSTGAVVAAVTGTWSYNATTRVGTFNPFGTAATKLLASTKYRVTVNSGIKDNAGNPLPSTSWTFTTGTV